MSWNPEDVVSPPDSAAPNLQKTLALSCELEAAIWYLLDPPGMQEMFAGFQGIVMKELHAFVHAGAPSVRLHNHGYPSHVLDRLMRQSNAMQTMAGMTLANLSGDEELSRAMSKIAMPFEACLPHLLRQPPGPPSQLAPIPHT